MYNHIFLYLFLLQTIRVPVGQRPEGGGLADRPPVVFPSARRPPVPAAQGRRLQPRSSLHHRPGLLKRNIPQQPTDPGLSLIHI